MLCSLIAYDAAGNGMDTLESMAALDAAGNVIDLIDFAAHEAAGGEATDIWVRLGAAGAKAWPEWLGSQVTQFQVELVGPPGRKRIAALIHKASGYRRERDAIEAAIEKEAADMMLSDGTRAKDLRPIVGGPGRPLILDGQGRTIGWGSGQIAGTPSHIPLIGGRR
jgi:hypothetical protein